MKEKNQFGDERFDYGKLKPILNANRSLTLIEDPQNLVVVFSRHRFYRHLVIELVKAERGKNGRLKNPFVLVDPTDRIWETTQQEELKFLTGLSRFKNNYNESKTESDLAALKAIIANPLALDFFVHNEKKSAAVNASSVVPAKFALLKVDVEINIDEREETYAVSGQLHLAGKTLAIAQIQLRYQYFVQLGEQFYLVDNPYFLAVIDFFKQHQNNLVFDRSAYENFRAEVLSSLEDKIKINYSYLKRATERQKSELGFDLPNEQLIYLSESADFVLITPVMKYGNLEIPIVSQKQIQAKDKRGKLFFLHRDEEQELQLITTIAKMHPYFEEQATEFADQRHADCFYMHRKHFLEPEWFIHAFEVWRNKGIAILGFNELTANKWNPYKAEIAIQVISGFDWFETAIKVKFNQQTVSLKQLHKSIRNKSKFVQLDDGTMGILPDEWLEKFNGYFSAGELIDDRIRTPHIKFATVNERYEQAHLSTEVKQSIKNYQSKLSNFEKIAEVPVPADLRITLRPYQKEGLNWLNFLDGFNFGACLADDMGLGKTAQVLAFILLQRERVTHNTNLVVAPASLVFNWQQEIKKMAPTLQVLTVHGADRQRIVANFDAYELILTSYSTMLADIAWLKNYNFNYVVLDESQTIKNPDSQRYKAARLLQSRNKIVLTGTPIENNTFDLYGQLSFACPGLLGSRAQFKRLYAVPIDQFKERKRAEELRELIHPFILRRTKAQVAKELPGKTEMIIYCEMGHQQREIYESCRDEIRSYLMGTAEDELTKSSMHVLKGITKLRQICNSPALLSKEKYYGNASSKMDVLIEQIESKAQYHKILVFSQFVSMLDLVAAELEKRNITFVTLTGQTKNRQAVVNSFQNEPAVRVFLISLKAGGVGLNLTQADYIYLIDPWWNPAIENQAIDRAYRIGQHNNVMAVRLICPETIEEKIMLMQENKKSLTNDIIKTEQSIFKSLSKNDLLKLL